MCFLFFFGVEKYNIYPEKQTMWDFVILKNVGNVGRYNN